MIRLHFVLWFVSITFPPHFSLFFYNKQLTLFALCSASIVRISAKFTDKTSLIKHIQAQQTTSNTGVHQTFKILVLKL